MDQELAALLARINDAGNPLSDDELAAAAAQIAAIVADVDVARATEEDIALLTEARDYSQAILAEQTGRADAAADRAAQAAALMAEIAPPAAEAEAQTEPEAETVIDAEASEVVAEAEAVVEAAPETVTAAADTAAEPVVAAAPAAAERPRLPSISHLAHRTPRQHRPAPTATDGVPRRTLIASADVPGLPIGQEVDLDQWAEGFVRRYDALRQVRGGSPDGEKVYVGSRRFEYPEDRILNEDENRNEELVRNLTSPEALVASGGICAPVAVDYSLTTIASAARPVRDSLVQFGANRGGVRYILPHTLAQVTADGPSGVWTEANDVNPVSPATKPHATFACQSVQEALVDAITSIVQFGNFQARYFPEQIEQYLATVDAVHARLAEATLLKSIADGSTATNADTNLLGATRDVLATVDRAAAAQRYRNRMAPEAPLRFVYPEWLEDMIRADLARQLPGDSGSAGERLAVADAQIDNFFRVRNINTTQTLDSPTGAASLQGFLPQNAGDLVGWPSKAITWLFPEGSWMFLDGGELNLGMVRDSTLNATNDFQMFSETFEKAIFRGHESLQITMDVCPSGASSGAVDASSLCTSQS